MQLDRWLVAAGFKTGGRQKGTPNKTTGAVKDMILQALNDAHEDGGAAYLKDQATKNPAAFMSLVGKVLPLQLTGDPENPVEVVTRIELIDGDGSDQASTEA